MNIIITAPKHLGKSTAVSKIISRLSGSISGFITEFINRDCTNRVLILRSIDGKRSRNAVVWRGGVHEVDYSAFDSFAASLVDPASDYVIIDELGKFETACENLYQAVKEAFDSHCHVIASIRLDAIGWMQELKKRDDVLLIELDEINRDFLPDFIVDILSDCWKLVQ